jgi:pyruvate dehydrogenase E1 component alpha subunit/2-oxoisovalerate dehydrogenase E1 component alpha subunit
MQEVSGSRSDSSAEDRLLASSGELVEIAAAVHRHMVRARIISARMVALQRSERIGFHTSSIGAEGAIVGAVLGAEPSDWIFPCPRAWYAGLARGMPLAGYVHHAFGSAEDLAVGHAAPDHAPGRKYNVVPPSGVVGAHLPQAVGAAWAARIESARGGGRPLAVAIALFGAEVASTGDFHNAMNFAGVFKAPVVFVCRAPGDDRVAERAVAYGLASARVDGTDALAVLQVVRAARARAGAGWGATLLEVATPAPERLANGDLVLDDDTILDLGAGDPLAKIRASLEAPSAGTPARVGQDTSREAASAEGAIARETRAELEEAITSAANAGPPARATLFDHVYAGLPAHLAAQRDLLGGRTSG